MTQRHDVRKPIGKMAPIDCSMHDYYKPSICSQCNISAVQQSKAQLNKVCQYNHCCAVELLPLEERTPDFSRGKRKEKNLSCDQITTEESVNK